MTNKHTYISSYICVYIFLLIISEHKMWLGLEYGFEKMKLFEKVKVVWYKISIIPTRMQNHSMVEKKNEKQCEESSKRESMQYLFRVLNTFVGFILPNLHVLFWFYYFSQLYIYMLILVRQNQTTNH